MEHTQSDYSVEEPVEEWLEKQLSCETVVDLSGLSNEAKHAIGDYNFDNITQLSTEELHQFLKACKRYVKHIDEEMEKAKHFTVSYDRRELIFCINTYKLLWLKNMYGDGCEEIMEKHLVKAAIVMNNWIENAKKLMSLDPKRGIYAPSKYEYAQVVIRYEKLKTMIRETHLQFYG